MNTKERLDLVAPCGIDCGICELYTCKDNPDLMNAMIERGIPKDKIPCAGCRGVDGNCPVIAEKCKTFTCVAEKEVEYCHECDEFPCNKLQPSADRSNILPHNMKVFNLCKIANLGVEKFVDQSSEIKRRYYTGKMAVGNGPQI